MNRHTSSCRHRSGRAACRGARRGRPGPRLVVVPDPVAQHGEPVRRGSHRRGDGRVDRGRVGADLLGGPGGRRGGDHLGVRKVRRDPLPALREPVRVARDPPDPLAGGPRADEEREPDGQRDLVHDGQRPAEGEVVDGRRNDALDVFSSGTSAPVTAPERTDSSAAPTCAAGSVSAPALAGSASSAASENSAARPEERVPAHGAGAHAAAPLRRRTRPAAPPATVARHRRRP